MSRKRPFPLETSISRHKRLRLLEDWQAQNENSIEDEDGLDQTLLWENFPSDVEVALYLLEREFPQKLKKKGVAPVLLESQLYSLIDNNNDVDREMEALRERGIFRKIRIADGRGNHGYGFIRETSYSDSLKRALVVYSDKDLAKAKKNTKDGKSLETLTYFVNIYISDIMPSFFDLWISREELESRLMKSGFFTESAVTMLVQLGYLITRDGTSLWISIPGIGHLVQGLKKGSGAVLTTLRRTKYKEVTLKDLREKEKKFFPLTDCDFILRYMEGSQMIRRSETTAGPIICLGK